ncbi:MAG: OsmC family protein [bacterium]
METIQTIYKGELRTEALHVKSGQRIITDAPPDNQGKGEAFSPTDLLCASLGSCMATVMGISGRTHQINLEGTSLKITKIMASNPRRVTEVILEILMPGENYTEKEKSILEKAALTCPVALSLHPDIKQTVHFLYSGNK